MWRRIANSGRKHYKIQFSESGNSNTIQHDGQKCDNLHGKPVVKIPSARNECDISVENAPLLHRNCVTNAME